MSSLLATYGFVGWLLAALRPLCCLSLSESIRSDSRSPRFTLDSSPATRPGSVLPDHDPPGRSPPRLERTLSFV